MRSAPLNPASRLKAGEPPARRKPLERNAGLRAVTPGTAGGRITPSRAGKSLAAGGRVPAEINSAATGKGGSSSGRPHSFPPDVAALLDARDPWCVHCGSADGLQRHHRRLKGIGGDGRDHTQHACNGVRLCWLCHSWAHSGAGQNEARDEGLIIPRATLEPFTVSVLVHLEDDRGGVRKWPSCSGEWLDEIPGRDAA